LKILITGVSGFAGRHLLDMFAQNPGNLTEIQRNGKNRSGKPGENSLKEKISVLGIDSNEVEPPCHPEMDFSFIRTDLRKISAVEKAVRNFRPDVIYHLAAQSSVKYSWEKPVETLEINVTGGINLFEAAVKFCPDCRILVACTAEEYKSSQEPAGGDPPLTEEHSIFPANPYAISKACLDFFSSIYYKSKNLKIFITRSFNHLGPGQSEKFVASDFAKQVSLIEKGLAEPVIETGNLEVFRDFLDVRDVVKAYRCIVERGRPGQPYNVCSGEKIKIKSLLEILVSYSTCGSIDIRIDRSKFRPIDTFSVYGDNNKLIKDTGWCPEYGIRQSLLDILNWWRERSF
jgi:GDP-4-dehydro-6-deoxy-D-mannose reductase